MKRFKKRLAQLTPEEAETVNRCHRQYVKTIPGKLDHASLVAVNLGKLSGNMAHSADPRLAVFPLLEHGKKRARYDGLLFIKLRGKGFN